MNTETPTPNPTEKKIHKLIEQPFKLTTAHSEALLQGLTNNLDHLLNPTFLSFILQVTPKTDHLDNEALTTLIPKTMDSLKQIANEGTMKESDVTVLSSLVLQELARVYKEDDQLLIRELGLIQFGHLFDVIERADPELTVSLY